MKALFTIILALLICCFFADPGFGQDYDMPKTLLFLPGIPRDSANIGRFFCNAGDQNKDGYDDLLIAHSPYRWAPSRDQVYHNTVELYNGGETMSDTPSVVLHSPRWDYRIGGGLANAGKLLPGYENVLEVGIQYHYEERSDPTESWLYLHSLPSATDTIPIRVFDWPSENAPGDSFYAITINQKWIVTTAQRCRPFDFNGDGWDDLITINQFIETVSPRARGYNDTTFLRMHWGGPDFDSIPDWVVKFDAIGQADISTGYDVNGDGCDDILVGWYRNPNLYSPDIIYTDVYLGGVHPSTKPAIRIKANSGWVDYGCTLVQDMNGDGYDDWAVWNGHYDKIYLYYGGSPPDTICDVTLSAFSWWPSMADMSSGDFNGDGYGDLIAGSREAAVWAGEVLIYFGKPGMPATRAEDIYMNGGRYYGGDYISFGQYVGAAGDYNGDGVDDFVIRTGADDDPKHIDIWVFAGNREWRVDAPEQDVVLPRDPFLKAYPNPFNSSATLVYYTPADGQLSIGLYDLHGRFVKEVVRGWELRGRHSAELDGSSLAAGVYIGVMAIQGAGKTWRVTDKLVLIK